jgi:hypothetical protein
MRAHDDEISLHVLRSTGDGTGRIAAGDLGRRG